MVICRWHSVGQIFGWQIPTLLAVFLTCVLVTRKLLFVVKDWWWEESAFGDFLSGCAKSWLAVSVLGWLVWLVSHDNFAILREFAEVNWFNALCGLLFVLIVLAIIGGASQQR